MSKKSYLDSIRSPLPCSKDWNEMNGDELIRFCRSCEKDVYNLSAMPRREARKLVARNAGKICVRYVRLPNGTVQTADTKLYKITRNASRLAAGVIGGALALSAITQAQTTPPPQIEKDKTVNSQSKDYSKTSQISFTLYSRDNDVIPDAEIKLVNEKTKKEFTAFSNQDGIAILSLIPQGRYEVEVSSPYFQSSRRVISIKEKIEPNIKVYLEVGTFTGVVDIDWYEIPFFQAIAQEDNETVKNLINSGFDVNVKDSENNTALHVAVEHGNLEIIRLLLDKGAKANARNKRKITPILMLEDNLEDSDKSTAEILRLLISKGADVNVQNGEKETLLLMACDEDNLEIAKILLEAGANPNLRDEDGETALQKTDSDEIKQLLISYGAKE